MKAPTGGRNETRVSPPRPVAADMSAALVDLVRTRGLTTTNDLCDATGMGRTVVAQRIARLVDAGLLAHRGKGRSTGGRAPRELRFRHEAATVFGVEVGVTGLTVGLATLDGAPLEVREAPWDVTRGPEETLARAERMMDEILAARPGSAPLAGIGVGLPCPVEFASGRPVSPPILSGWDDFPVRERLAARFGVGVWVDNEVNAMALGELRSGIAQGVDDFIYVKVGTGIGAGLVSAGRLHRGAQGCAGDIAHLCLDPASTRQCRCGKTGCLQTFASGSALGKAALDLAERGASPALARRLAEAGTVTAADVSASAAHGDPDCVDLMSTAGAQLGEALTSLVNIFNPALVVIGGGVSLAGDLLLPSLRKIVYARSLPLATRDLRVVLSAHADRAGVVGAALTAVDELLGPAHLDGLGALLTGADA